MANYVNGVWLFYVQINQWFILIVHVISTCTATKILYVLPDNVSDVNCPSQPCAALDQYLLDNGSLPVLSDVEYYFLPGEHHIITVIVMVEASNFSLIGLGLLPAKLVCRSHSYVGVLYSHSITIRNLVFDQCSGTLASSIHIAAGLYLYKCSHCIVENVTFYGYGFVGFNLLMNSHINNVTIDLTIVKPAIHMCSPKFFLSLAGVECNNDRVLINQVFISGYNELCNQGHKSANIQLYKSYGIDIILCNSQFYNTTQLALRMRMEYTDASVLVKNCTFKYIIHNMDILYRILYNEIPLNNATVRFENCTFSHNVALYLLIFHFGTDNSGLCVSPSNVTVENCNFINNSANLMLAINIASDCKTNVILNEAVNFANNMAGFVMSVYKVAVHMNGTITIFENNVTRNIIKSYYCEVTFAKTITFLSNICNTIINMISHDMQYIKVLEYADLAFINNTYHHLFVSGSVITNVAFPYCIFQYITLTNNKFNLSQLLTLYTISFNGNRQVEPMLPYNYTIHIDDYYDFLTHCQWLPTAVFKGYDPGYINHQIIQVDGSPWVHHKAICCCPPDGNLSCTIDLLGPVYPGQLLQIDLCMPQLISDKEHILYVETHSASLPRSICKLAHPNELIDTIGSYYKTYNYTIVSESELCELVLIAQTLDNVRSAFYVKLSPCPVGFTLQNGKCDCDPFLPPDIDTCYIDLSAITRPANTWITAHTLTNNTTNYLISDCPMDYCLPYSTNVNLLYPDLQCQFNRTGILCSQCQHPLSMVFASSRCMKCTNVHILITIIVIVAGIVLVVLLYVLNLTVTKGTINGIIFYANIVSINDSVFLVNDNVFKPLRVFISFTNLDLGIETCFYDGMDSYAKMWLQLFFPSYLIIITVSIIIASRYSSRILRLTYSRSLPVLATLFLLSYTGVLRVILTVLFSYSIITEYPNGDKEIVWSIDASVPLFGLRFTILFITCLVLFLILIPFNITLLCRRYLAQFRIVNYLKPLLDTFHGSYKDRYYYWIAVHIILRSIFFSLYTLVISLRLTIATIVLVLFTVCYGYLQPNKNKLVNIQELSLLANLLIMHAVSLQQSKAVFSVITNVMIGLAFAQCIMIIVYHFITYTLQWNIALIAEKFIKIFKTKKRSSCSYDVILRNIPERAHNYNEYQDGLVSDDFM